MMEALTLHHLLEISFGLLGVITGGIVFFLALRIVPTLTLSSHQRVLHILAIISLLIVISELIGVVVPFFRESALIYVFEELVELVLILFGAIVLYFVGYAELKEIAPLRQSAEADDLTGLSSRSYFSRVAVRRIEFSQINNLPLTCIVLDVDDFKEYNDRHGHGAGDEALRWVARALRKSSRADDLVARHGGEEFVLLMGGDLEDALDVAERVRQRVKDECTPEGEAALHGNITVSLGVALLDDETSTLDRILEAADREMYRAKELGKNQVSVADSREDGLGVSEARGSRPSRDR
jgi:diguanylate cyclase (GGDEF)-like protein